MGVLTGGGVCAEIGYRFCQIVFGSLQSDDNDTVLSDEQLFSLNAHAVLYGF